MTQYFYNGVLLPALPEWDKETYPYAAIFHKSDSTGGVAPYYQFVAGKEPITRYDPALGSNYYYRNNTTGWVYRLINDPDNITSETVWGDEHVQTTVLASAYKVDLIWANHDVIKEKDGSVYLPASDPVPVEPEQPEEPEPEPETPDHLPVSPYLPINGAWVKHDIYKQVGNQWVKQPQKGYETQQGMWQAIFEQQLPEPEPEPEAPKEPIAYMYGTKQLPPLPEYDTATYPYVYIAYYQSKYNLYLSTTPLYYDKVNMILIVLRSKLARQWRYADCAQGDTAWSELSEEYNGNAGGGHTIGSLYWCNVDCYNYSANTLYLAASEPVPVYE